ncbi:hypothetical protein BDN72DRAFT_782205 [Pluteus cervinus]|uniref:Uncharacterized protein n=1 Tax=Pluteus cervinus TaxID=181527 RepID=A0ACD2ZY49_9AGAR|nr:hypothetical protein BDN72DRAFT_782205 [Pluteus cervinus]
MILPSKFLKSVLEKMGLGRLKENEIDLRCGQATDALDELRLELGRKAFEHVQKHGVPSKKHRTRGWTAVHNQEAKVRETAVIYRRARKSLIDLGAKEPILEKYRELKDSDLTSSTSLLDHTAFGQSQKTLPWFWACETGEGIEDDKVLREFHRAHWLRAWEQNKRAEEEFKLVKHEMRWTLNYFRYREQIWRDIASRSGDLHVGYRIYAYRQADIWCGMENRAREQLREYLDRE